MKKLLLCLGIVMILNSCNASYSSSSSGSYSTEKEYQALMKTYKPETAAVLNDLLNDSSNSPNTSITVENKSSCNMVLTISGDNYFKKIPIGAHKIGSAMVLKNQSYQLSGKLCDAVYQNTKFISSSYNITLSN